MRKLLVMLLSSIITLSVYSQSQENIDSVNVKYNRVINKYEQMKNDEIKKLSSSNYLTRKSSINIKYDTLINKVVKTRDGEISVLIAQITKNAEIKAKNAREAEELKRKIDAQNEEIKRINAEKEEIEQKKKQEEEYQKQNELLAKKQQELKEAKEIERRNIEFEASDLGKLQKSIKTEFNAWLFKTSFETDKDYETRIKTQADTKFNSIKESELKKNYHDAEGSYSRNKASLSEYDINNEQFKLYCTYFNRTRDTLDIKVPKQLAQDFYRTFTKSNITLYPTKTIIYNNRVKVLDVVIVFNNHWLGDGSKYLNIAPIYKTKNGYSYYQSITMTDINSLQKLSSFSFPDGIYYLEHIGDKLSVDQSLNINYQDLNIILPTF